jgi:ABC-type polysaccharide/polyol phosphate transport system ATPase subunit
LEGSTAQSAPRSPSRLEAAPAAVVVEQVGKEFRLPHERYSTLKERALHPLRRSTHEVFLALDDVSFQVRSGEFFGVVGRNGSGKSTLLKCLAGVYQVDRGHIEMLGRVSPFIELGVGFNPDLTARDNVLINAIMLGLSRREARRRFDEIIDFAELREFIDLKLKNYSSGMSVRLGFSVAIQVDADVVLVDEVLAVGDAAFQRKCFDEFERMRSKGRTVLFVTHDMNSMERFCDRALLLEHGRVVALGEPDEVGRQYNEVNFGHSPAAPGADAELAGSQARIRRTWCEEGGGDRIVARDQGQACLACVELEFLSPTDFPFVTVTFRNESRHTIFVAHSATGEPSTFKGGERATYRFAFDTWLAPGRYTLTSAIGVWDPDYRVLDQRDDVASLIVEGPVRSGGVADLPTRVEIERS